MTDSTDSLPTSNELSRLPLGASIRKLRKMAKMKESTLARETSMSQSQVSKIENGRIAPSLDSLRLILAVLKPLPAIEATILAQFDTLDLPDGDYRKIFHLGIDSKQRQFREFEIQSTRIRSFEMVLIPGLL